MELLGNLTLILLATTIVGHFSTRIGIPAVIGQLLVGIVLGPAMLGWLHLTHNLEGFAEIGVIVLMFIAGLESDLQLLKRYLKPSVFVAILGVIVPVLGTFWVAELYHLPLTESMFLGVIFAATSVSISVEVLKEMNALNSREGTTILGAAVVDDVLAVIILSVLVSTTGTAVGGHTSGNLLVTTLMQVVYFAAIYFVVKWLAPYMAKMGKRLMIPMGETLMAIILCFGMAYVAELVGLSDVVGAFFAGIAISQTSVKSTVDRHIEPVGYAVFIPVFFVSIGLNMDFNGLGKQIGFILVLTVVAVASKLIGAGGGAKLAGFSWMSSTAVGAGMVSRGEMALIIAQIGYQAKLMSPVRYSAIVAAIILATLVAPFLLRLTMNQVTKGQKDRSKVRPLNDEQ
ncbi:cation:proton antiporter [Levilactobacillus acidifarinae]|uniref:Kef-type K+ transport system, membrane component n=1 Tax=Levilactobacillus acidifarinae DSM 19394 = JCM 15949 TaxID=1423715 RepID=A0A0R1LKA1_9LACO|nr:cation:proton antiporter [Levilactobacillus acidifarinae]KRK96239.1 Kef-type K+ transport system, membrane component [Levilactobacillus acidifarinae DSM 19394]GEO69602.1 sodium:proton antiporter [Levilactobacillus acidifarinae]